LLGYISYVMYAYNLKKGYIYIYIYIYATVYNYRIFTRENKLVYNKERKKL